MGLLLDMFNKQQEISQNPIKAIRTPQQLAYEEMLNRQEKARKQEKVDNIISGLGAGLNGVGKIVANAMLKNDDGFKQGAVANSLNANDDRLQQQMRDYAEKMAKSRTNYIDQAKEQLGLAKAEEKGNMPNTESVYWTNMLLDDSGKYTDKQKEYANKWVNKFLNKTDQQKELNDINNQSRIALEQELAQIRNKANLEKEQKSAEIETSAAAQKASQTEIGKTEGNAYKTLIENADKATEQNEYLNQMSELLDSGIQTGRFAETNMKLKELAGAFGLKVDGLPEQQAFVALSNKLRLGAAAMLKGSVSDREQEIIARTVANLGNTPEGNRQVIKLLRDMNNLAIEKAEFAEQYRDLHNGRYNKMEVDKLFREKNQSKIKELTTPNITQERTFKIMTDKNGNKAKVYSDGTIEEIGGK